jgi:hypothetical protein
LRGDTSGRNLSARGSSRSTDSLSKRRAHRVVRGLPFRLERSSQRHKLPRRRQVELLKNLMRLRSAT